MKITNLMKTLVVVIIGVAAWLPASCPVEAATVTLNFDPGSGFGITSNQNATEKGFRISANSHIDFLGQDYFTGIGPSENGILGVDGMAPGEWENEFLGPPSLAYNWNDQLGVLYIDFPDHKFQLESILVWYRGRIISSKGGDTGWFGDVFMSEGGDPEALPSLMLFDASDWTGLDWIALLGRGGEPHGGYDAITVKVPETSTLALLGLALSGLAIFRRRGWTIGDRPRLFSD